MRCCYVTQSTPVQSRCYVTTLHVLNHSEGCCIPASRQLQLRAASATRRAPTSKSQNHRKSGLLGACLRSQWSVAHERQRHEVAGGGLLAHVDVLAPDDRDLHCSQHSMLQVAKRDAVRAQIVACDDQCDGARPTVSARSSHEKLPNVFGGYAPNVCTADLKHGVSNLRPRLRSARSHLRNAGYGAKSAEPQPCIHRVIMRDAGRAASASLGLALPTTTCQRLRSPSAQI